MDAGLGGEGGGADEGSVGVRRAIEDLVEGARGMGEPGELLVAHTDGEAGGERGLELERADQRDEIGIAAALAQTVQRALHLADARLDGGDGIGHRTAAIVMGMDAETVAGHDLRHARDDVGDFLRKRAAIGVAEHHPARAGLVGGAGAGERIIGIGLEAVEEMLAINHRLATGGDNRLHALADGGEIVVERRLERDMDVIVPALGDKHDRIGRAVEHAGEARIVGGGAAGAARHAEGGKAGIGRALLVEEGGIERIGTRNAALHVIDAEPVEQCGDGALVLEREIDARRLRAVAQGRVEKMDAVRGAHVRSIRKAAG